MCENDEQKGDFWVPSVTLSILIFASVHLAVGGSAVATRTRLRGLVRAPN